jgi:hypothetical protein
MAVRTVAYHPMGQWVNWAMEPVGSGLTQPQQFMVDLIQLCGGVAHGQLPTSWLLQKMERQALALFPRSYAAVIIVNHARAIERTLRVIRDVTAHGDKNRGMYSNLPMEEPYG